VLSVLIPAKNNAKLIASSISRLSDFLSRYFPSGFQIIVSVNGDAADQIQKTAQELRKVFREQSNVVIHEHFSPQGKGASLRSAFNHAKGDTIAFIDSDLPYDLSFFVRGVQKISQGFELILGNRRLHDSHFVIPVPLLSLAYGRHRLGLIFNRVIRLLFSSIETRDTQAGIKMMSRRVAEYAFAHQHCPGFFFDVELILSAQGLGSRIAEQPVTLHLNYEKSTIRLVREGFRALRWLYQIKRNERRGEYRVGTAMDHTIDPVILAKQWSNVRVTADDWGLSPAVNDGILDLVKRGVVRRVSMLADGEYLDYRLKEILALGSNCEFGMHFNLTYGSPPVNTTTKIGVDLITDDNGNFFSPGNLIPRIWRQRKCQNFAAQIEAQFCRQWQKLRDRDIPIDYFDGHHHVHLFPGMIGLLKSAIRDTQLKKTRLVLDSKLFFSGKLPLLIFSFLARRDIESQGLSYLPCYYPDPSKFNNTRLLIGGLQFSNFTEVITHPATQGDLDILGSKDSYNAERVDEYQALLRIAYYLRSSDMSIAWSGD
jgi:predicted glycoside hydrolase/deacetylase ChbG (UPF0249 family)/glycosyltransferase involved in cell wall biosynthesis